MNYETMHLFAMSRAERNRCLTIINDYYRLHLPDFPLLKSLDVLKELFAWKPIFFCGFKYEVKENGAVIILGDLYVISPTKEE